MGKGQKLYIKAKTLIPGGTQLLSKRPEMFLPDYWPSYYSKAKGCVVTDLDGTNFYDMCYMGIGACVLGYAFDYVDNAAKSAIDRGSLCTLNAPEEVELAEKLIELHPWADMVRYGKAGGEAMAIATRIARAATGNDIVLICGYHGWQDWYLATNLGDSNALNPHHLSGLEPTGVPQVLQGTTLPFLYNDYNGFITLAERYKGKIAAIVMEPIRNNMPIDDFLVKVRDYSTKHGIVLIYDEITAGFRLSCGGSHKVLGVEPDIAVFAKAIANGYPISAIVGKKEVMTAAQDSFISSTFWTERIGVTAALASIAYFETNNVEERLIQIGKRTRNIWESASKESGLAIHMGGILPLSHFTFNVDQPLVCKTLFTQLMLDKGFLASIALYASIAHTDKILNFYDVAIHESFLFIAQALKEDKLQNSLRGPVSHAGFQRLN